MIQLECGIVTSFIYGHNYGYMRVVTGEKDVSAGKEIVFRFEAGRFVKTEGDEVVFVKKLLGLDSRRMRRKPPRRGQELVFTRGESESGRTVVTGWAPKAEYNEALHDLTLPRYRLVRIANNGTTDTAWEGRGVRLLPHEFRLSVQGGRVFDPLEESLSHRYRFEGFVAEAHDELTGENAELWHECQSDPRDRSEVDRQMNQLLEDERNEDLLNEQWLY